MCLGRLNLFFFFSLSLFSFLMCHISLGNTTYAFVHGKAWYLFLPKQEGEGLGWRETETMEPVIFYSHV